MEGCGEAGLTFLPFGRGTKKEKKKKIKMNGVADNELVAGEGAVEVLWSTHAGSQPFGCACERARRQKKEEAAVRDALAEAV